MARLLPPESSSVERVSREVGISVATLERWRAAALANGAAAGSQRWTAAARLEAVIVTAAMDEAARSAWCREQGLYPAELDAWKRDAIAGLGEPRAASAVEARQDQRWGRSTRNWTPAGAVTLNPERDIVVRAATSQIQLSGSIGEPAFPPRPGSAQAAARNAGDGRSRATRSHAQSALAHEHGEAGEHRTFSAGEHRGTLGTSRRFASPDIYAASTAASSIGGNRYGV